MPDLESGNGVSSMRPGIQHWACEKLAMVSTREHDPYRETVFHSIVSSGIVQADRVPPQLLTSIRCADDLDLVYFVAIWSSIGVVPCTPFPNQEYKSREGIAQVVEATEAKPPPL